MKKLLPLIVLLAFTGCAKKPYLSGVKDPEAGYAECHRYTEKKDFTKANECLELLRSRFRSSPVAIQAELEVADNYYRQKDYLVAAEAYQSFARVHPADDRIDYVYYRTSLCYLKEAPKAIDRDQHDLGDALHYLELAKGFAKSPYAGVIQEKYTEARTRMAKRHFYIGRFYYRRGEYLAAIPRFEEIVTDYTELGLDERSLYYLGRSYLGLSEKEKALEILAVFDEHFPKSRYRTKLKGKIGL